MVRPCLCLISQKHPMPVKSIPAHFCPVYEADAKDVALIFGDEKEPIKAIF